MNKPLSKLKSILSQSDTLNSPRLFFPLLHEFSLMLLRNHEFQVAVKKILASENKIKRWISKIPHKPTVENRGLYLSQYQNISACHSLNQIRAFFERYDWAWCDAVMHDLVKQKNIKKRINYTMCCCGFSHTLCLCYNRCFNFFK